MPRETFLQHAIPPRGLAEGAGDPSCAANCLLVPDAQVCVIQAALDGLQPTANSGRDKVAATADKTKRTFVCQAGGSVGSGKHVHGGI